MTPKELKKLADACRKAGIKHYKEGEVEFTLTDEAPVKPSRKTVAHSSQTASNVSHSDQIESDSPSDEDLLFWSTGVGEPTETKDQ